MANATFVAAVGGELDFSDKNSYYLYAVVAVVMAGVFRAQVLAASEGTQKMQEIGQAVQEGAAAYLSRQFRTLAVFALVALAMLVALDGAVLGWQDEWRIKIGRYVALLLGAGFSALIGYLGMWLATRANIRVAAAAQGEGREVAMRIAFRTGGMVGMLTVGLGLLGAGAIVLIYTGDAPVVLEGFGFGAALLAMFMRVGGGIFTKAADVGADLVGKVEQNIPEDDPRNAATIADNVGDNVGDCAGMAADLFESYAVTLVAALILGSVAFGEVGLVFPLVIPAIGALTAILGVYLTRPRVGEGGLTTINRSFYLTAIVSGAASIGAAFLLLPTSFSEADLPGIDVSRRARPNRAWTPTPASSRSSRC
jgi:K(+)-stimulated pyrophosphate-energized sodium pump